MRALITVALSSILFTGFRQELPKTYQVISSHPHDVQLLGRFTKTVHQSGRLTLVQVQNNAPQSVFKLLREIDGSEKSYRYSEDKIFLQPQTEIERTLSLIGEEKIKADVEMLSGFKTRLVNTDDNRKATQAVIQRFQSYGYETSTICYRSGACSVIADKKGSLLPQDVMMVMGHIDSVGADFAGADDNASGTAVILEMARVLKDGANKKTLRFFVTNGEESGLLGAKHYAQELKKSGKIKELVLAINMDMVGYNQNGIVELETAKEHDDLARWFAELASTYTTLKSKITLGAWGSDHVPFLEAGVPTLLTIEDWSTKTPCYHQKCDRPETLNYGYATEIAKLNIAAVLTKDGE